MRKKHGKTNTAILHYSAPPVVGGVEAVIQAHCQVLRENGFPISVIAGRGDVKHLADGTEFIQVPEIDSQHSQVLEISAALEQGIIPESYESFTSTLGRTLAPILRGFENLIVHNIFTKHFNLPLTDALFQLCENGVIKNCIAWCHDFSWTSPNSRSKVYKDHPWDLLKKYNSRITYITVSQGRRVMLAELFNQPEKKIKVIYNGVDPKILLGISQEGSALIQRLNLLDCELIILMPVRVTKAKNIEYALHLLKALKTKGVYLKLILTGPPDPHSDKSMSYYRYLQDLRHQLDLDDNMRFVFESGPQSDQPYQVDMDVVGDLFRVCDLVLMPSHREGFGMPVLEAGLAGIPVVCTQDVPAAVEIGEGDVIVFDTETGPVMLAERIKKWMEESPQYRFRQRVRREYTWEAIFNHQILPLLEDTK